MRRLLLLALVASTLAGCGSSDCAITDYGTKLCDEDVDAYCVMIDGANSSDRGTQDACA